jgi:methylase of polypeptide subunit release factors
VLGYIFEKYINQRQMGAYYTKEDITEYICRSTIVPFLIDHVATPADWALLQTDPERYIFEPVLRGLDLDLPAHIAAGVDDVAQRTQWNTQTADAYKLPTEIWRETVARRQRASALIAMLQAGEVTASNQLITHNLDVRRFLLDVIAQADAARVMRLWERLQTLSVLDPTVGSGAFLFAALTILTPVYVACIDRLAVLGRDGALGNVAEAAHDMQRDLKAHKSLSYTVLKRIMVNNLYGVDIMEEAVEICKLRLFLKLTAQISELGELEPLPDIDFNIRAGNTLVGYARLADAGQTQAGRTKAMDLFATEEPLKKQLTLVKEQAATYRTNQANLGASYADKQALAAQMTATAEVLNLRLADAYGVDVRDAQAYAQWKTSHKPFHWCSEFYDIVEERGGFDVIVGNPPYVEYAGVRRQYEIAGYRTEKSNNLFAFTIERSTQLLAHGALNGMIIQLSAFSTISMKSLQEFVRDSFEVAYISTFPERPKQLFDGAGIALTIFIATKGDGGNLCLGGINRFNESTRDILFEKISYVDVATSNLPSMSLIPKFSSKLDELIFCKVSSNQPIEQFVSPIETTNKLFYRTAGGRYWKIFLTRDFANVSTSNKAKSLQKTRSNHVVSAILNSNVFWWFFANFFDLYNLKDYMIFSFPYTWNEKIAINLDELGKTVAASYENNAVVKTQFMVSKQQTTYFETFQPRHSKHIIDEIDRVLAAHYGFTDEELDYIINYDIKYRMGLVGGAGDDVEE